MGEGTSKWRFGSSLVSCHEFYLLSLYFVKVINWQINWLIDWLTFSSYCELFCRIVNCNLHAPPALGASVVGDPFELCRDVRHPKTRVPGLSCGVVCMILRFSRVSRTPTCDRQTDRETDRQTHDYGIYRDSMASHGKNWQIVIYGQQFDPSVWNSAVWRSDILNSSELRPTTNLLQN